MVKLVHRHADPVVGDSDAHYHVWVRGAKDDSGLWHGWLEFIPAAGGPTLFTGSETTQREYDDLEHWASGLSPEFYEAAFERADAESEPPFVETQAP